MIRPRDILRSCAGFEWDEGNATRNWAWHDVLQTQCEQVFFNNPLLVRRDSRHSAAEPRYYALGCTDDGRLLFVVFTVRGKLIRVISARDMTPEETRRYES
ncbi:MAG: BrnT family toxin [bacterium]